MPVIINSYRDLNVWEKSMELARVVYGLVKFLPKEELYALSDQMRRAVVSIPSNIAEGAGRRSEAEFAHFLDIALGSAYELETQLIIAHRRKYLTDSLYNSTDELIVSLQKRIGSFIVTLTESKASGLGRVSQ